MAQKSEKIFSPTDAGKSFFDNPFESLQAQKSVCKKGRVDPDGDKNSNDEDARLFLSEFERLGKKSKHVSANVFGLAEICQLPEIKMVKQSKKVPDAEKKEPPPGAVVEVNEFLNAIGKTEPLKSGGRDIRPAAKIACAQQQTEVGFGELLGDNLEFALLFSDEYFEGHVAGLDERIMTRLRNGQMSPEAHLDLHGLNSFQAYEALRDFFRNSWFKGMHVVLLVPGRGLNSPNGRGILRQKLQTWLTQEPFKRIVLGFCTARPHDGGPGSVYVLLRKFRKKGRIYWDRMPSDPDLY